MNVHSAPIGMFDSGFGGLSVALEVRRLLPAERLLYAADNLYCPYGSRSPEEIRWRTLLAVDALIERGIKMLIIACNTATAVVLEELRGLFAIPIIGLEPAVKPAIEVSRNGRIAVLATPRTAASGRLHRLIQRYGQGVEVRVVPAPGLVELVEAGAIDDDRAIETVKPLIQPLVRDGVDTVVLGCTHFPFLRETIQAVAGHGLTLVDSGAAIARRANSLLDQHGAHADGTVPGGVDLLTTGDIEHVGAIASRLLEESVSAAWLPLPTAPDETGNYDPAAVAPPKLSAAWTCSVSAGA